MIERIAVEDIRKQYNSKFMLQCSFTLERGPLYTIIGPNGSGKSTLLRILSLIEPPDSGKIIYHHDGASIVNPYGNTDIRRKAVLVPTRAGVFNDSVFNNIAYGLKVRRIGKHEIRERVRETLRTVKLEGKEGNSARELSSGEAQRLALARALVIDPDIFFLDEPTASLDPDNTKVIEDVIDEQRRSSEKIMIMVTHNLFQAKALSDYVVFMYKGSIREISDRESFFESPSSNLGQKFMFGEVY